MFKASWRTTAAGIAAILTVVGNAIKAYIDNDPSTTVDLAQLVAGISAGLGLLNARDNKVTSEAAGAKEGGSK